MKIYSLALKNTVLAAGLVTGFTLSIPALAQNLEIKWSQSVNIPKGQGLPSGVSFDIIDIQIGDSFTEAKAKLEKHRSQNKGEQIRTTNTQFRIPAGGNQYVMAKYPSKLSVRISKPAVQQSEEIDLYFSAPSSGAQLYAINRNLSYFDTTKQPRISDTLNRISEKYKAPPTNKSTRGQDVRYTFKYDNAQAVSQNIQYQPNCGFSQMITLMSGLTEQNVRDINKKGNCDQSMTVIFGYGLSADHAKTMSFYMIDSERAKANLSGDFKFLRDYVDNLAKSTSGSGPKL